VGFWIEHFAVGGFLELALRSWWIFIWRGRIAIIKDEKKRGLNDMLVKIKEMTLSTMYKMMKTDSLQKCTIT